MLFVKPVLQAQSLCEASRLYRADLTRIIYKTRKMKHKQCIGHVCLRRGYRLQNRTSRMPLAFVTEELYLRLSTVKAACVVRFVVVTVGLLQIQVF